MSNKRRGPTYSTQEVDHLLDALREHLPIGPEEWDLVGTEHIKTWGENGRDTTSLRRKFNQLVKQKMGTGDPNCPQHVREAKRIMISIRQKSELDTCEPESKDDNLGFDEETEADFEERAPVPIVSVPNTSVVGSAESESGKSDKSITSETVPIVSPRLRRLSTPKKKKDDEMSMTDFFKFSIMQREQDRKDREMELREERKRKQEGERRREEEDRMFRNLFLAAITQDKNVKPDDNTK